MNISIIIGELNLLKAKERTISDDYLPEVHEANYCRSDVVNVAFERVYRPMAERDECGDLRPIDETESGPEWVADPPSATGRPVAALQSD